MTERINSDKELITHLKRVADYNKIRWVIVRGLIIGIFSSLGTLLGLAFIFFIGANLLGGLKQIPLIDTILEQTKLDIVIESQVNRLRGEQNGSQSQQPTETEPPIQEPKVISLTYTDKLSGFEFNYPSTFTASDFDSTNHLATFSGNGELTTLEVYFDQKVAIVGNSSQRILQPKNGLADRVLLNIYEKGGVIGSEQYKATFFHSEYKLDNQTITFIGFADPDSPKAAREVFIGIVESLRLAGE